MFSKLKKFSLNFTVSLIFNFLEKMLAKTISHPPEKVVLIAKKKTFSITYSFQLPSNLTYSNETSNDIVCTLTYNKKERKLFNK